MYLCACGACLCACVRAHVRVSMHMCGCARLSMPTCSRFQSRISAMPKYPFSFGPSCLKKMSGFRIKSLSGGI